MTVAVGSYTCKGNCACAALCSGSAGHSTVHDDLCVVGISEKGKVNLASV